MRAVLQRVSRASVEVAQKTAGTISQGLLIYLGIESEDSQDDIDWLCRKICAMRIFADESGKMNRSLIDVSGEVLVISQFTLHASTKKGNGPSFIKAAPPAEAEIKYEVFITSLNKHLNTPCQTGIFGADMAVSSVNDGPVTIILDTKNKE